MTVTAKKKKLHDFINAADDHQIIAFYNKVEGFISGDVTIACSLSKMEKLKIMKQAPNDPLLLADMKEISDDFDHWNDEGFLKELQSRIDDYESGRDKGIPWEEVKQKARERLNKSQL